VHLPVFSIKFMFFGHDVQKSGVPLHVPQVGSHGLQRFWLVSKIDKPKGQESKHLLSRRERTCFTLHDVQKSVLPSQSLQLSLHFRH
jgi:hypothetical protein